MSTIIYWTVRICSFHPNSKSVSAHLGRALHVFFLPLSGSGWTISSSSLLFLLLLKAECTLQVSLSESSLKLPLSEFESFTISLIVSFPINIFCEVFSKLTLSPCFLCCLWCAKHHPTTVTTLICSQAWCEKGKVTHCA